jgi:hypothetical protein
LLAIIKFGTDKLDVPELYTKSEDETYVGSDGLAPKNVTPLLLWNGVYG